jgi:tetratricopeptide (TPR) repeat protein
MKLSIQSPRAALLCCLMAFTTMGTTFSMAQATDADGCLQGSLQLIRTSPERRLAGCSTAILSGKLDPSDLALARLNRGIARMAMGDKGMANVDYEEALKHYDSLIDAQKADAMVLYRRGVALDALGQTDRALADDNEATRQGPQFADPFFERGLLLATRKG